MDAGKDNANPTIINPSDLPSRRKTAARTTKNSQGIFRALAPIHVSDPSDPWASPTDFTSSDDSDDAFVSGEDEARDEAEDGEREEIDEQEIYDLISTIMDPEHPLTLGSLGVVNLSDIKIFPPSSPRSRISSVQVLVTPTTSACSLTTVIGLGVKVRLVNALPPRFRIDVRIKEGTSASADEANKQLGDKERVAAAMENRNLINMVNHMLSSCA
jgi:metal-sulfur cluster biosynthetic enzyme